MANVKKTIYSLDNSQRKEIEKKLKELLDLCQIYHVPMFTTVAIENTEEGTEYNNITYGAKSHNIILTDDHIRKHILVADGFEPSPKREVLSINLAEVFDDE